MIYDYTDDGEIPDFDTFTNELIEEVLCSAFFQVKTKKVGHKINLLKIIPVHHNFQRNLLI